MNKMKIAYWIFTVMMCALFIFSAQMYLRNPEMIQGYFESKGFAPWIVIPLAIAKLLGVVAILTDKSSLLREWAYAGFFFDLVLATAAHHYAGHGIIGFSFYGLITIFPSYFLGKYIRD